MTARPDFQQLRYHLSKQHPPKYRKREDLSPDKIRLLTMAMREKDNRRNSGTGSAALAR